MLMWSGSNVRGMVGSRARWLRLGMGARVARSRMWHGVRVRVVVVCVWMGRMRMGRMCWVLVVVVMTKVVIIVLRLDTWIVSVLVQALALATTVVLGKSWVALIGSFGRSDHNVVVRVRDMCWTIGRT